ncbi:hypothetical protein [Halobacillus aidingensis]|uniref:hypothetical protein n=1 Tax=Halobacillus aidingensis TaxID=240303 RepID=UPI000B7D3617|nr:hypothetical protein [Halobacillus aidingensis]
MVKVFSYVRFFLFMSVGLSLWQLWFSSFNPVETVAFSFFMTFFKWLYEVTWERKTDGAD